MKQYAVPPCWNCNWQHWEKK